jgi:large exoprotein involved in heme utilization and adhesion
MQKSAPLNCDIRRAKSAAALLGCTSVLALTVGAQAQTILPRGGSVAAGQVSIGAVNGNTLSINQGSPKAIVNWDSFSIGSDAVVNFVQPGASAAILNRRQTARQASRGQAISPTPAR